MRRLSTGAAAALFALVAPIAVRATTFTEIGDAGALPASANVVDVVDPTRIDGRIEDGADADLFALTLTASTSSTSSRRSRSLRRNRAPTTWASRAWA